jgi:acylphosphatase
MRMCAARATERRTVCYSGHVQGVGFRFTARSVAGGYAVGGFVRNLPDGRVELVAEGEAGELTAFLAEIHDQLGGHIRSEQCDSQAASGEFLGFEIRH